MLDEQKQTSSPAPDTRDRDLAAIHTTLEEILQQLKHRNRLGAQSDFSYTRLIASVAQLIVIALLFWTIVGLADLGNLAAPVGTMLKIFAAVLLQLLALTFFFLDHHNNDS
jgi:hypothetical protein